MTRPLVLVSALVALALSACGGRVNLGPSENPGGEWRPLHVDGEWVEPHSDSVEMSLRFRNRTDRALHILTTDLRCERGASKGDIELLGLAGRGTKLTLDPRAEIVLPMVCRGVRGKSAGAFRVVIPHVYGADRERPTELGEELLTDLVWEVPAALLE
ncbi:MAG: hypothetical protein H6744_11070 [Deltaproteobacteria bacterium]|nr:hypothetical protein [Deltaproteobacteria bacterium]MCB9787221.1 hypothetical protein [Deltaproteobacteria bacterium]